METEEDEVPPYRTRCTAGVLWRKYRIYDDRIELDSRFGLMKIPFENIEGMEIRPSGQLGALKGHLHLRDFRPELMLDWSSLRGHAVVDVNLGWMRRLFITPRDLEQFKSVLDAALLRFEKPEADAQEHSTI
jgi:hypothetical protein